MHHNPAGTWNLSTLCLHDRSAFIHFSCCDSFCTFMFSEFMWRNDPSLFNTTHIVLSACFYNTYFNRPWVNIKVMEYFNTATKFCRGLVLVIDCNFRPYNMQCKIDFCALYDYIPWILWVWKTNYFSQLL